MNYQITEDYFNGHDGLNLFRKRWVAPEPKAVIVLAHGLGEHCDRYHNLLNWMDGSGVSFYALDHRGHGRSAGVRGHVNRFEDYTLDLDLLLKIARDENPGLPLILLGHSLGGMIAYYYAVYHPNKIDGLILSSAGMKSMIQVPPWKWKLARFLSVVAPTVNVSSGLDANGLSHDPAVVAAYNADPLVHGVVTGRWFLEFNAAARVCSLRGDMLRMPLLIIHGSDDPIVDPYGSQLILERANSVDKELIVFPGLYHETMNEPEPERAKVLSSISDWLQLHFLSPQPEQIQLTFPSE
ncbi:MAG: alpha/beta hydrolase [Syntrophomonadaceae bacterium]|nr:alpha/beta hydrolase [Syntrophomonadaceae bacterium]